LANIILEEKLKIEELKSELRDVISEFSNKEDRIFLNEKIRSANSMDELEKLSVEIEEKRLNRYEMKIIKFLEKSFEKQQNNNVSYDDVKSFREFQKLEDSKFHKIYLKFDTFDIIIIFNYLIDSENMITIGNRKIEIPSNNNKFVNDNAKGIKKTIREDFYWFDSDIGVILNKMTQLESILSKIGGTVNTFESAFHSE
jgi:hypothetical protein